MTHDMTTHVFHILRETATVSSQGRLQLAEVFFFMMKHLRGQLTSRM